MKRSEAIKLLSKEPFVNIDGRIEPLFETEADNIVRFLEDLGMRPPVVKTEHWNRQDNDFYYENEWEPENE